MSSDQCPSFSATTDDFALSSFGSLAAEMPTPVASRRAPADVIEPSEVELLGTADDTGTTFAAQDDRLVALQDQLVEYEALFYEDHGRRLDVQSRLGLMRILRAYEGLRVPSINAESNGLLVASWYKGDEAVVLRLLNARDMHFALVLREANGAVLRPWGSSTWFGFFEKHPQATRIAT